MQIRSHPPEAHCSRSEKGSAETICSIDSWDPPRNLQFSMGLGGGEIAYDFHIEANHRGAEIHLALNLERSLNGVAPYLHFS